MNAPPTGTVTFLFTDIEGSTRLWAQHTEAMMEVLARHDVVLGQVIEENGGWVFKTVGDAFCAAFSTAGEALAAALGLQLSLQAELAEAPLQLRVRCALHTGQAEERNNDYFGPILNRVARLLGTAHGSQTILSLATRERLPDKLPEDVSLRDLGLHRLRDLEEAEHVFQLDHPALESDFPPLASEDRQLHNLPREPNRFVGRQADVESVSQLLGQAPLVTLTGAGGTGKTRLALQVAAGQVNSFTDGAWLVELAPLADPTLVLETVAAALKLREAPGTTLRATLMAYLRRREILIVLDNCEHMVDASARLAADLLAECPGLTLLATSREAMGIAGEVVYEVPPLAVGAGVPSPGEAGLAGPEVPASEAAQLFAVRAAEMVPSFELTAANLGAVEDICSQVDGLALAIELAAARIRSLAPEQIAARLGNHLRLLTAGRRGAEPRQRTMRGAVDWSYQLLTAPEQTLLGRLSVFSGGWSLDMAESVSVGESIEEWEVLDLLERLVEKSLVRAITDESESRFLMYETIRQYAFEQLGAVGGVEDALAAHLSWCARFASEAQSLLQGPDQAIWLARLETEHDNCRVALASSMSGGPIELGLQLAADLWLFWYLRGYLSEGRRHLGQLLANDAAAAAAPAVRGQAAKALGALAYYQGDYATAKSAWEESLGICQSLGDQAGAAKLLNNLGTLLRSQGDYAAARDYLGQCLDLMRAQGDQAGEAGVLHNLALVAYEEGRLSEAQEFVDRCLQLERAIGDPYRVGDATCLHASIALSRGDYEGAESAGQESLGLYREIGADYGVAEALAVLVRVACDQGALDRALQLGNECLELRRELGDDQGVADAQNCLGLAYLRAESLEQAAAAIREGMDMARHAANKPGLAEALLYEGQLALEHRDIPRAEAALREGLEIGRDQRSAWISARVVERLMQLAMVRDAPAAAVTMYAAAGSLRAEMEARRPPVIEAELAEYVAAAHAALGPERAQEAETAGRRLGLEEAQLYALTWLG